MREYINAVEFNDFKRNQDKLIQILNHNVTQLTNDVSWLKRLTGWQIAVLTAIFATLLGVACSAL